MRFIAIIALRWFSATASSASAQPSIEEQVCGKGPQPADQVILATPHATFHNATLQVYRTLLEQHGVNVRTVTGVEHHLMYPYFTGDNGTKQCVDLVVSSDLPNNHAPWLKAHTNQYEVAGTCYELLQIYLAAPVYAQIPNITALSESKMVNKTIIGFAQDPCARCPDLAAQWIKERLPGFSYQSYAVNELKGVLEAKLAAGEHFVSTWWAPSEWAGLFPSMKRVDMEEFTKDLFNQGKALVRKTSKSKLPPAALQAYGAVFLGTATVSELAYKAGRREAAGSDNAPAEVAAEWIAQHPAVFDMFSW